jgi:hypothetical protein
MLRILGRIRVLPLRLVGLHLYLLLPWPITLFEVKAGVLLLGLQTSVATALCASALPAVVHHIWPRDATAILSQDPYFPRFLPTLERFYGNVPTVKNAVLTMMFLFPVWDLFRGQPLFTVLYYLLFLTICLLLGFAALWLTRLEVHRAQR